MSILGDKAVLLNALSVSASTFFFVLLLVSLGFHLFHTYLGSRRAAERQGVLWLVVGLPWLAAVLAFTEVAFFPLELEQLGLLHFHHIYQYDVFSWHSLPSLVLVVLLVIASSRLLHRLWGHTRSMDSLLSFAGRRDMNIVDLQGGHAFTSGFLTPRIYISQQLLNVLDAGEQQAVIEHERAHQRRRDPLRKLVFSFAVYFFPAVVARSLTGQLHMALEQSADEYAASRLQDEAKVASALLQVARAFRGQQTDVLPGAYCAFAVNEVRSRIHYLMNPAPEAGRSLPLLPLVTSVLLVLILNRLGIDVLHHFTESFFQH